MCAVVCEGIQMVKAEVNIPLVNLSTKLHHHLFN